jgi:GntR family transcriptional regulator/MocR family aminotransferase
VIEDDYDSEFRYDSQPIPSLQGLDVDSRVIYAGTFSKAMFAGVRFAYLVVPSHVSKQFCETNSKIYRPGQLYLQAALADFLKEGYFSQHIRRMRQEYAVRQHLLRQELQREFGGIVELSNAQAGLHLYAKFKLNLQSDLLIEYARKEGLVLGSPKFITPPSIPNECGVVLGYGAVSASKIVDGVNRLSKAVQNALRSSLLVS